MKITASQTRLQDAIVSAIAFLARNCAEDGRFVYKIDLRKRPRAPKDRYNLIRHSGVVCCLLAHAWNTNDENAYQAGSRGLDYALRFKEDIPAVGAGISAIFTDNLAKLGATALTAAALTLRGKGPFLEPDRTHVESFGDFLISQQDTDGHFRSIYFKHEEDYRPFESVYYPGEAILALSMLSAKTESPKYRSAALHGAMWLARRYSLLPIDAIPADHWLMIAIDHLDARRQVSEELRSCVFKIAESIIRSARCGPDRQNA